MRKFLALILLVLFSCQKEPIIYNLTTSTNPNDGGKIIPGSQEYEEGESVTLIASPFDEYVFDSWTGAEGTTSTTTITMDSNKSVVANFIKKKYTLTLNVEGEGEVSKSVVKAGITESSDHNSGTVLSLSAIPEEEWEFSHWTGDLTGKDNPKEITIDKAKTVTAVFIKKKYPLTVEVEGQGSVAEKVIKAGLATDYNSGTIVELTATAETGWEFKEWTGDITGTDNPSQITIDESKKVRAVFKLIEYKLTVDIDGLGDVEVLRLQDRDSLIYNLTAIPDQYNAFIRWEGDLTGDENPTEIYLDMDKKVKAIFENGPFYLDDNGVTVKAKDWAEIGDKGTINGVEYTLIDEATLRQMVADDKDVTRVVTSRINNMSRLFAGANGVFTSFNQDISNWDVSNVTDMSYMFHYSKFNQPINDWNVSNVTKMNQMFWYAENFNQDLNNWDVSNVTTMDGMFDKATEFNGNIGSWNVSNVIDMRAMFAYSSFNKDISEWNVSNVTLMSGMFYSNGDYNQPLDDWDVSNVTRMGGMFARSPFNQDLSKWDVSSVTDMEVMFEYNDVFNQDISDWNVSNVTNMKGMFLDADAFNQDIGSWDVSSVTNMDGMFHAANVFNQDLSSWCVSKIDSEPEKFSLGSSLTDSNKPVWGICNATDLVAWYPFNGNANDESGNGNNPTTNTGAILTSDRYGNLNSAYSFDGINDYLKIEEDNISNEFNDIKDITISSWSYMEGNNSDGATNFQTIIGRRNFVGNPNGERHAFELSVREDGELHFTSYNNQDTNKWGMQVYHGKGLYKMGQWNHFSATFNSSTETLKLFLNGELVFEKIYSGMELYNFNHWINIGAITRSGGDREFNFWNGILDDIAIWRRALTDDEIKAMYSN
jgi:surface protein